MLTVIDRCLIMIAWILGSFVMTLVCMGFGSPPFWLSAMTLVYYVCSIGSIVLFLKDKGVGK